MLIMMTLDQIVREIVIVMGVTNHGTPTDRGQRDTGQDHQLILVARGPDLFHRHRLMYPGTGHVEGLGHDLEDLG